MLEEGKRRSLLYHIPSFVPFFSDFLHFSSKLLQLTTLYTIHVLQWSTRGVKNDVTFIHQNSYLMLITTFFFSKRTIKYNGLRTRRYTTKLLLGTTRPPDYFPTHSKMPIMNEEIRNTSLILLVIFTYRPQMMVKSTFIIRFCRWNRSSHET